MMYVIIILVVFTCLCLILYFSTLTVQFHYQFEKHANTLQIKAKLWKKISIYSTQIPLNKLNEENGTLKLITEENTSDDAKEVDNRVNIDQILKRVEFILNRISGFYKIIAEFLRKVHVSNFKWHTNIGFGDAALTGVATGAIWSLKGILIGFIGNKMILDDKPDLMIYPLYQLKHSQIDLSCMISFKIGNAIVVALRIVKHWKGRE